MEEEDKRPAQFLSEMYLVRKMEEEGERPTHF
jgi:hypothetical protein